MSSVMDFRAADVSVLRNWGSNSNMRPDIRERQRLRTKGNCGADPEGECPQGRACKAATERVYSPDLAIRAR